MKEWLTNNKIYFETAAATALAAMAVLVSFTQLLVGAKQNQLVEAQLVLARQAASPNIHAAVTQIRNPETNHFDEEELRIYNLGAPALAAEASNAIWLLAS